MALKLKFKLILPTVLLFALALGITGWHAYTVAREQLRQAVGETLSAYCRSLAFSLDDAADNMVQDLRGIGGIPPVTAILAMQDKPGTPRYSALQDELNYSLSTRTLVRDLTYTRLDLLDKGGRIVASNREERVGQKLTPVGTDAVAYAEAMRTGKPHIGAPVGSLAEADGTSPPAGLGAVGTGQTYVPIYVPIASLAPTPVKSAAKGFSKNADKTDKTDKADKTAVVPTLQAPSVGCVVALVDFSRLAARLTARVQVDNGYAIIMGPGGQMMHHPKAELVMEPVDFNDADDPSNRMVREKSGVLQYDWNGAPWLALFRTGEVSGWTAAVKVDLATLYDPITLVLRHIMSVSVLWVLLFGVSITLMAQRIVSGLLRTIDYARRVSGGALHEELTVKSGDEVGILADALRHMVHSLRAALAESLEHQRDLESISQQKTDFLANMSHEIRTPMNALMGFLALFRKDNLDGQQRDYMQKISVASKAIVQIVNDVLDLSKIEKGKLHLEHQPFALRESITAMGGIIEFTAAAKGCTYSCRVDDHVPDALLGDVNRLQQVLFNLLGNAVKFTQEGGVSLTVRILPTDCPAAETRLLFEVRDSGIGIAPAELERLFTPYEQADVSITRRFGGTGLGLTISKKLVELMGGDISVTSELGQGSCFSFSVRVGLAQAESALQSLDPHAPCAVDDSALTPAPADFSGFSALVVEDNVINQEIICAMLEAMGLTRFSLADNGQEALAAVQAQRFDIILMDMQMPVMDGITATEHLRQRGQHGELWLGTVPIVALTANALSNDVQRCLAVGMNAHVSKPIMPDILQKVLSEQLLPPRNPSPKEQGTRAEHAAAPHTEHPAEEDA